MIFVIVGPTGIGKTALSIAVAKHLDTEIISGDSVQVYRGFDIGSSKVSKEDRQNIRHHMIDILEPEEPFSVAIYQQMVRSKLDEMLTQNKHPLIVGGTGYYIRSVLHDYHFYEDSNKPSMQETYQSMSNEALYNRLKVHDNAALEKIHPNNRKRLIQALYRAEIGKKISHEMHGDNPLYDYRIIGLECDRQPLYQKLDTRVDAMFVQGLLEEVKNLYDKNIQSYATQAIGYKELYDYFSNTTDLDTAKERIKQNTRRYAKRQYTYFRNQLPVHWIKVSLDDFDDTIRKAINFIDETLNAPNQKKNFG